MAARRRRYPGGCAGPADVRVVVASRVTIPHLVINGLEPRLDDGVKAGVGTVATTQARQPLPRPDGNYQRAQWRDAESEVASPGSPAGGRLLVHTLGGTGMHTEVTPQRIPVTMYRSPDRLTIAAPMPGVEPEDIRVEGETVAQCCMQHCGRRSRATKTCWSRSGTPARTTVRWTSRPRLMGSWRTSHIAR